jgi:hypothetical protein
MFTRLVLASLLALSSLAHASELSYRISDSWQELPEVIKSSVEISRIKKIRFRFRHGNEIEFKRLKLGKDKSITTDEFDVNPDESSQFCWELFLKAQDCVAKDYSADHREFIQSKKSLLDFTRELKMKKGLAYSRNFLYFAFKKRDFDRGLVERRLISVANQPEVSYVDSLRNIPEEDRKKYGVYFLLGILGEKGPNAELVKKASDEVAAMGFNSEVLKATPDKSSQVNAEKIRGQMKDILSNGEIEKVVIVGVSKGVSDFLYYFYNFAQTDLDALERQKVELFISLAGVVTHSEIASWLTHGRSLRARTLRTAVRMQGLSDGVSSLSNSFWEEDDLGKVNRLFPKMEWISVVALPEGNDGFTHIARSSATLLNAGTNKDYDEIGPTDGMVESAAQVLPAGTGIEETIIPVFGPHGMSKARLSDGSPLSVSSLSPETQVTNKEPNPVSGSEMIDLFFKAIPSRYLD